MKKKSEALKRFLQEGFDPLDEEMEAALEESAAPAEDENAARQEERVYPAPRRARGAWYGRASALSGMLLCLLLIGLMLLTVADMPYFGAADTLVESEVSEFYLRNSARQTNVVNVISAIILNYRGFDTLGESHVLFLAVISVLILLNMHPGDERVDLIAREYDESQEEPHDDEILQTCARLIVPIIAVFGFYIILNGNLSPGGGFSGGAVLGAALILFVSVYGYERASRFFTYTTFRVFSLMALMTYTLAKGYHFITGANGIENGIPLGTYGSIFSGGLLLPLNICVGIVVACTMYALFTMFRKGDF